MQLSSEIFNFGIERFRGSVGLPVNEVVEDFVLPLVDCGTDCVEVWVVEVGYLVVPLLQPLFGRLLGECLVVEEASQGVADAIGLLDVRI